MTTLPRLAWCQAFVRCLVTSSPDCLALYLFQASLDFSYILIAKLLLGFLLGMGAARQRQAEHHMRHQHAQLGRD